MENIKDWTDLIGEKSEQICPHCLSVLFKDKVFDWWCSKCAWGSDEDTVEFAKSIGLKWNVRHSS